MVQYISSQLHVRQRVIVKFCWYHYSGCELIVLDQIFQSSVFVLDSESSNKDGVVSRYPHTHTAYKHVTYIRTVKPIMRKLDTSTNKDVIFDSSAVRFHRQTVLQQIAQQHTSELACLSDDKCVMTTSHLPLKSGRKPT